MSGLLALLLLVAGSLATPPIAAANAETKPGTPVTVTGSENGVVGLSGTERSGRAGSEATSHPPVDILRPTCMYRPTLVGETRVTSGPWRPEGRFGASYFFSCPGTDGVVWLDAPSGLLGSYRWGVPGAPRPADEPLASSRSSPAASADRPSSTRPDASRPGTSPGG
ncbi:MAG: hypothetical protein ACQSGP_12240 [Frankia sp.]